MSEMDRTDKTKKTSILKRKTVAADKGHQDLRYQVLNRTVFSRHFGSKPTSKPNNNSGPIKDWRDLEERVKEVQDLMKWLEGRHGPFVETNKPVKDTNNDDFVERFRECQDQLRYVETQMEAHENRKKMEAKKQGQNSDAASSKPEK